MSKLNKRGEKQFDDGDFIEKTQDSMNANTAITNIECGCDFPLYCESFQYLLDNGIIPHLQGWYQREAQLLIDNEYINK